MMRVLIYTVVLLSILSCKQDPKSGAKAGTAKAGSEESLPAATAAQLTAWKQATTAVDLQGLNSNVTMSFDNPTAVSYILSFVNDQAQMPNGKCGPDAHLSFIASDGTIITEADAYFANGCSTMVFFEKGKRAYANLISSEGIDFFKNFLKPVSKKQDTLGQ